jgi:hypothetical protein
VLSSDQLIPDGPRQIGYVGTAFRVVLGVVLLFFGAQGSRFILIHGHFRFAFDGLSVLVGVVLAAVVLAAHWLLLRHRATPLRATGPVGTTINFLVIAALLFAPSYAPRVYFVGGGAAVFYGVSMLLAALRGTRACELLTISNWVLGRDDQVGCPVLTPLDNLEVRRATSKL